MKWTLTLALFLLFSQPFGDARAETFPTKPVTLVVPYAPGGSSDIMGRNLAQQLGEVWSQPVVVENRPGATTTVGAEYVSRAPADGYTLLLAPPPFVITQHVYPDLKYKTDTSFEPISLVAYYPMVLVVNPNLPVHTIKELVEHARANPGVTYLSPGAGTTSHLVGELLAQRETLDMVHVPYKSGGQGVVDLIAGRIDFYAGVPTEVIPHVQAGKLRAIATLAAERSQLLPDVPNAVEAEYDYLQIQSWSSIVAPKGTPQTIVDKISADIAKAIAYPDFRERLIERGAVLVGSTPDDLKEFYVAEHDRFGPLVKSIGLKPEQ
ncbi:Bug family tripartite tricarboxylate transporter substrate binding protein [Pseudochelatococcus sp. B33]